MRDEHPGVHAPGLAIPIGREDEDAGARTRLHGGDECRAVGDNAVHGGTLTELTFEGASVADIRRLGSGNQAAALMEHAGNLMRLGYCADAAKVTAV